jgi:retron-type reverse transcriptase
LISQWGGGSHLRPIPPYALTRNIENFFGSITRDLVYRYLVQNGFKPSEADAISNLCTNQNRLPQGAPTSPLISNAILYDFDKAMTDFCVAQQLVYSRYADDITVSGDNRDDVRSALEFARAGLRRRYQLQLNVDKTRIANRGGQQRVTGVVVNVAAAPPRAFRRRIRAMFHQALLRPGEFLQRIPELGGYIGYLKIFPNLASSREVRSYEQTLHRLRRTRTSQEGAIDE